MNLLSTKEPIFYKIQQKPAFLTYFLLRSFILKLNTDFLLSNLVIRILIILLYAISVNFHSHSQDQSPNSFKVHFVIKRIKLIKQTIQKSEKQHIDEKVIFQQAKQNINILEHELEARIDHELLSFYPSIANLLQDELFFLESAESLKDLKNEIDDFLTNVEFHNELSGSQRFLSSEYFTEWLRAKETGYTRMIKVLKENLEYEKNTTKQADLTHQINHYQSLLNKVKLKLATPLSPKGEYSYSTPDKLMGIEFLHSQGLFGQSEHIKIKVFDNAAFLSHQFWKPATTLTETSQELFNEEDHATHIVGTLANWPRTINERKGIAPNSDIELLYLNTGYSQLWGPTYEVLIREPSELSVCKKNKNETIQLAPGTRIEFEGQLFPKRFFVTKPDQTNIQLMPCLWPDKNGSCQLGKTKSILDANDLLMSNNLRGKYSITNFMITEQPVTIAMAKYLDYIAAAMEHSTTQYIINYSQNFIASPMILESLERFILAGGLIVMAAGNDPSPPDENGYLIRDGNILPPNEIFSEIGFKKWLKQNPQLQKGILFVGGLDISMKQLSQDSTKALATLENRYICAWGDNVVSTTGTRSFDIMSGTSMAAPTVTGIIAVLKGAFPNIPLQTIGQIVLETANTNYLKDYSTDTYGVGMIDGAAAYMSLEHITNENPPLAQTSELTSTQSDIVKEKLLIANEAFGEYYFSLGEQYFDGRNRDKDYLQALYWFRLAANIGDSTIKYFLGELYLVGNAAPDSTGKIIHPDRAKAIYWLEQAAAHENSFAQEALDSLRSPIESQISPQTEPLEQIAH